MDDTEETEDKSTESMARDENETRKSQKNDEDGIRVNPGQVFVTCHESLINKGYKIQAKVYELPPETKRLPNFNTLDAVTTVCLQQLDITRRNFETGFPGVKDLVEWFALDIRFRLQVPSSGKYTFTLNSDDGSKLYINEKEIIDNDGQHTSRQRSGSINLKAGTHNIRVTYFQGPRYHIALELFWKSQKIPHQPINPKYILKP